MLVYQRVYDLICLCWDMNHDVHTTSSTAARNCHRKPSTVGFFFWGLPWPFGWLKYPTFYVASYVYPIYPNKLSQKWTNLSLICIYRIIYYPGWWYTYHSEKYELVKVSWDDFPFPTEWKVIIHSMVPNHQPDGDEKM